MRSLSAVSPRGSDYAQRKEPATKGSATRERARRHYLRAALLLVAGASMISLVLSPYVDRLSDTNLVFHMMVEHPGLVLGGLLSSAAVEDLVRGVYASGAKGGVRARLTSAYLRVALANSWLNRKGRLTLPLAAFLLVFWQLPYYLDLSEANLQVHELWHLSLIIVGVLLFLSSKVVSGVVWFELGVAFAFADFAFAYAMVSGTWFYRAYPLSQQMLLGDVMFALMTILWILIVVYGYFAVRRWYRRSGRSPW